MTITAEIRPIKGSNLTVKVKEMIKEYISSKSLSPGTRLPSERELTRMLNVSRNIVREALKSLEEVGIVEIRVGNGVYVSEMDYTNIVKNISFVMAQSTGELRHLIEMRLAFELAVLELVAVRATDDDIAGLERIVDRLETAETMKEFGRADKEFHQNLIEITANPLMIEFCSPVTGFFARFEEVFNDEPSDRKWFVKGVDHRSLVNALKTRDISEAREVMKKHIFTWEKDLSVEKGGVLNDCV